MNQSDKPIEVYTHPGPLGTVTTHNIEYRCPNCHGEKKYLDLHGKGILPCDVCNETGVVPPMPTCLPVEPMALAKEVADRAKG